MWKPKPCFGNSTGTKLSTSQKQISPTWVLNASLLATTIFSPPLHKICSKHNILELNNLGAQTTILNRILLAFFFALIITNSGNFAQCKLRASYIYSTISNFTVDQEIKSVLRLYLDFHTSFLTLGTLLCRRRYCCQWLPPPYQGQNSAFPYT